MTASMQGKTVLITGANSGIGKETAVALARAGATVVFTSRDPQKGEQAAADIRQRSGADVTLMPLNLASFTSIRALAQGFLQRYEQLHVLINNAGLILSERTETEQGFETTFGVNHLGHFLLTQLLLDRIKASAPARIVNVSSGAHRRVGGGLDFDDLQATKGYGGWQVYGRSKLANIYFTRELARRLQGTGVSANALHPGVVATGFARDGDAKPPFSWLITLARPFFRSPEKGAQTSIYLASDPKVEGVTGKYFADSKETEPTAIAQDDEAASRLWTASEELIAQADA
ncbi:MAG: SDR family oxidoreductase [Chloroflexi bacterium]|nr:SDR family oxidoreductase [Chloroflexota bacterium]